MSANRILTIQLPESAYAIHYRPWLDTVASLKESISIAARSSVQEQLLLLHDRYLQDTDVLPEADADASLTIELFHKHLQFPIKIIWPNGEVQRLLCGSNNTVAQLRPYIPHVPGQTDQCPIYHYLLTIGGTNLSEHQTILELSRLVLPTDVLAITASLSHQNRFAEVFVHYYGGALKAHEVDKLGTVKDFKHRIHQKRYRNHSKSTVYAPEWQYLFWNGVLLEDHRHLLSYGFGPTENVRLVFAFPGLSWSRDEATRVGVLNFIFATAKCGHCRSCQYHPLSHLCFDRQFISVEKESCYDICRRWVPNYGSS